MIGDDVVYRGKMIRTLIKIHTTGPAGLAISTDVCQAHAAICAMFPTIGRGGGPARALYSQPRPDRVIVQAPIAADVRWLPRGTAEILHTDPAKIIWEDGARIRWAATLNPTTAKRVWIAGERGPTRITPVRDSGDAIAWVKAHMAGLMIDDIDVVASRQITGTRSDGTTVTLYQARLIGTGTVTDPDRYANTLALGVGRGKAYGCGLVVCEAR